MILQILKLAREKKDWDLVDLVIKDLEAKPLQHIQHNPTPINLIELPPAGQTVVKENDVLWFGNQPQQTASASQPQGKVIKDEKNDFSFVTNTRAAPSPVASAGQPRLNLFVDTGEFRDLNDQKLYKEKPPRPKPQKRINYSKVKCSICGIEESVAAVFASTYSDDPEENLYKCDRCMKKLLHERR